MKRWKKLFDDKNGMRHYRRNWYHGSEPLVRQLEYQLQLAWLLGEQQLLPWVQWRLWLRASQRGRQVLHKNYQLYQIKKFLQYRHQI